ncbi:MAG: putative ABC transporter permease [Lachnospiraceae bacterium]|nr:putative ABC transporter permease [Lachnospiraceae bacterium]
MIPYTFAQVVFFFLIYCVMGWIIESTYVSITKHKFINRGFMRGPVIPIYGLGALTLRLTCITVLKYPVLVFFTGMISCTILEYIAGMIMEAVFKIRYWDYTNQPLNINGYVCMGTSLSWGALGLLLNYVIHRPVEYLATTMSYSLLLVLTVTGSAIFIVDLTLAFKAAFDVRAFVEGLNRAKGELSLIQKRLDVMVAYINDSIGDTKDRAFEKLDNWSEGIEQKMEQISDGFGDRISVMSDGIEKAFLKIKDGIASLPDNMKEEFFELKGRFASDNEKRKERTFFRDFYRRGLFEGNPSLSSRVFKTEVEELKDDILAEKKKSKDKEK